MRLIDADELKKAMDGYWGRCQRIRKPRNGETAVFLDVMATVEKQPTIDTVPVPIRHGKWIDSETFKRPWFRHHIFECSVCRNTLDMDGVNAGRGDANYCPNCGADMRGEKNDRHRDGKIKSYM